MLLLFFSDKHMPLRTHYAFFPIISHVNWLNKHTKYGIIFLQFKQEDIKVIIWDGNRKLLKGNTHMHTTLSDGRKSVEDACSIYKQHGYDFVVITDHRKVTTQTCNRNGMLCIQGIEFDFNLVSQVVHIIGVGVPQEIGEAVQRFDAPQKAIDTINQMGGVAILAHPAWSLNTPDVIRSFQGICGAEIYNTVSNIPWNLERQDSSNVLDMCAAAGQLLPLIAADDAHYYEGDECKSYIMLYAEENTEESIKDALRKGDFYATQGPEFKKVELNGDELTVTCSPVKTMIFPSELPWGSDRVIVGENITQGTYKIQRQRFQKYVRVMIEDAEGKRAWLSPIQL